MDKHQTLHNILTHALPLVPFDGWSESTLAEAAKQAGLTRDEMIRCGGDDPLHVIDSWMSWMDKDMEAFATGMDISKLKIRERIATLVMWRLEHLRPYREAVRRTVSFLILPWNLPYNLKLLHRTVDTMWQLAGDNSTDYNWYTKRMLLAGVYSSTLMVWLNDETANLQTTRNFLHRRIENVLAIGKLTRKRSA